MKGTFKIILIYFVAFILFYLDPIHIFSIKFALLWKLIVFIFVVFFVSQVKVTVTRWVAIFFLYSFLYLINRDTFFNPIVNLGIVIKILILPVFYLYFKILLHKKGEIYLLKLVLYISVFILLSTIPFLLNIITPISEGYDLSKYGLTDTYGLIGIFQNPASASIHFTYATIIFFFLYKKIPHIFVQKKIFFLPLLFLGIYDVYYTYVRTGLLLFFLWFLIYFFIKRKFLYLFGIFALSLSIFVYLYSIDKVFRMRITDTSIYNQNVSDKRLGSGRVRFNEIGIDIFKKSSFVDKMIGVGRSNIKKEMNKRIGLAIYTHNAFLDILLSVGLFGFLIFIYSWILLFYKIKRDVNRKYYYFILVLYFINIIRFLLQPDIYSFLIDILLAILIVLNEYEHHKYKLYNVWNNRNILF